MPLSFVRCVAAVSIKAMDVVKALSVQMIARGVPVCIRSNSGTEFFARINDCF
jgi:hypothetical protein